MYNCTDGGIDILKIIGLGKRWKRPGDSRTICHVARLAHRHIGLPAEGDPFLQCSCGRDDPLFPLWNLLNRPAFRLVDPLQLLTGKYIVILFPRDMECRQSPFGKCTENGVIYHNVLTRSIYLDLNGGRSARRDGCCLNIFLIMTASFVINPVE